MPPASARLLAACLATALVVAACGDDGPDRAADAGSTTVDSISDAGGAGEGGADGEDGAEGEDDVPGEGDQIGGATLGEPAEPPTLEDEDQAALAAGCFEGVLVDCDELYFGNLGVQEALDYGATCGGRLDEGVFGQCVADHGDTADP